LGAGLSTRLGVGLVAGLVSGLVAGLDTGLGTGLGAGLDDGSTARLDADRLNNFLDAGRAARLTLGWILAWVSREKPDWMLG